MPRDAADAIHGFLSRRGFVQVVAASAATALLPACSPEQRALGFRPGPQRRTTFITPNEEFYLVAVDPDFRPAVTPRDVARNWSLEVVGLDGTSRRLGYAELFERATRVVPYTFECIGNEVGGQLIGNARWHVLPLREVIAPSGGDRARSVRFEGLDDF